MAPVFIAMAALVGGALLVAVMQNKKKKEEASSANVAEQQSQNAPQASNPFADRDNDPKRRGSTIKTGKTAPAGLMETATWVEAKKLAEQGTALVKEAQKARNSGDEETYREKGREGHELLDEAMLQTGDWLIDLLDKYPDDGQVDKISRIRGRWGDSMKKVKLID